MFFQFLDQAFILYFFKTKPDLIKVILQLESEMNSDTKELISETKDLVTQMQKSRWSSYYTQNINEKLVNQLIETEQQC